MRKEQGFTLIELLIVVAIIAIIAAIAVPNLMDARMAANETSAIAALRAISSAEVSYSVNNNGIYGSLSDLVDKKLLDSRYADGGDVNGYRFVAGTIAGVDAPFAVSRDNAGDNINAFIAQPISPDSTGRYCYGVAADAVIRYVAGTCNRYPKCDDDVDCKEGDPVGGKSGA